MAGEAKVHILHLVITITSTSSCIVTIIMLHCGSIAPIHVYTAQNKLIFLSLQMEYLTLKIKQCHLMSSSVCKVVSDDTVHPARCATLWPNVGITRSFFLIVT